MKAKFTISLIFIFVTSFYLFGGRSVMTSTGEMSTMIPGGAAGTSDTIQGSPDNPFLIGALDAGWDTTFIRLDELGFNAWHKYSGNTGWMWIGAPGDSLYADINIYRSGVQNKLSAISSHGMKSIIMRPKIAMLCYGQRSDYQCEDIPLNDDLWFYSFQSPNHVGEDIYDTWKGQTQRVRYCERNIQTTDGGAGWVVSRLKSNAEQCNTYADGSGITAPPIKNWIVKPRIRIDSAFASNPSNWETAVCKIKVIGQNGDTVLKDVDITAINFLDSAFNYDGRYIEEYNFTGNINLEIDSLWGREVGRSARGNDSVDHPWNKIDIQVYWYGNCDMWIDYVRVDNMVAHELFRGDYDNNWLLWEAQQIACYSQSSAIKFYMELFAFSNIPCMSYVSRKLDDLCSKDITLTALMSPLYMHMIVPWKERFNVMNTGHVIRNYVEKVGLTDILIANYPFYTNKQLTFPYGETFAKIPNTLPVTSGPGVLAYPISPSAYDDWLQNNLDHSPGYFEQGSTSSYPWTDSARQWEGAFRWSMKMGDAISKEKDIPFYYNGQAHLWYYADGESHKEPTNQEMEMIANVSLTYGARGLLYFFYGWWDGPHPSENNPYCLSNECYGRGFADPGNIPRTSNAYGQDKWEMIKGQVQRMKKWDPYIMSFDNANRKGFIYYISAERNEMSSSTFLNELKAFPPVEFAPIDPVETDEWLSENPPDSANKTYLQAGFFNKPNDNGINKYFMIVNRRCSPYKNNSAPDSLGGRRLVTMKVNSSELSGFNNWTVINLEDSSIVATFDKNTTNQIYIGDFMPGQGKLFRVAPVMQEGGTLVADEEVNLTFNCNGVINCTNKNISLGPLTKISFANGAGINMTGGVFQCGEDVIYSSAPELKAKSNSTWAGINLTNCSEIGVFNTTISGVDSSISEYMLNITNCYNFSIKRSTFDLGNNTPAGGIAVTNMPESELPGEPDLLISDNTFISGNSDKSAVRYLAYASITTPLIIEWNIFTASSSSTSDAVFLSGVTGGVVKNNYIGEYYRGVNMLNSSVDFYDNDMISEVEDYRSIFAASESNAGLSTQNEYYTGGLNSLNASGRYSSCIEVENSLFDIKRGENTFDIAQDIHLTGYFPICELVCPDIEAESNCFKVNGLEGEAYHNVTWGYEGDPVNFLFEDYSCGSEEPTEFAVFGNDTIYMESGGTGGGLSSISGVDEIYSQLCIDTRKENTKMYSIMQRSFSNNTLHQSRALMQQRDYTLQE